ncbi:hypothetical protein BJV78DRAFT_51949 [Lactifluus subvellereus]|nr:hypothetical protein BJV78DRAFT_51949 [Lactifluus subvellereus]
MPEDPNTNDPSSSRHHPHPSLITSASGMADSTISFNTYATGITEESLCLSQFPPPPMTLPASPITERSLSSPAQSTFTVTAPASTSYRMEQGYPSPAWSTFTVTAPALVSPGLSSPAQSAFTVMPTAPVNPTRPVPVAPPTSSAMNREPSYDCLPSKVPGRAERPQHSDPRAKLRSPPSLPGAPKLSPFDWHEGSSTISVDLAEERMLSTSFITGLLSSANSVGSLGDSPRPSYQADVDSLVSEMSYHPSSSRYHDRVTGSTRIPSSLHLPRSPVEGRDPTIASENDTITSYERNADVVQPGPGLTRKVSVVGMAPATLRHVSATSIPESHPQSPDDDDTHSSTILLNPYPFSAFHSGIKTQPAASQRLTPITPLGAEYETFSKPFAKRRRRESEYSSKTVKSHVSSLISSVSQRTTRAARTTMEWMRIKPLPPLPTIASMSLYQEQEHRRMEDAVPLPQLAERADRLTTMLNSGHLSHDSISSFSGHGFEKISPLRTRASGLQVTSGGRRRQSVALSVHEPGTPDSPLKSKSFFKQPINRNVKIRLFAAASGLTLLVLIGVVVGVVAGRKYPRSLNCPANRTGNTCSLDSTCVCISSNTSQCNPLAQSLVNLIPIVNGHFNVNFTLATVVDAMSSSHASTLSSDCAAQARVVDVSPALDSQVVPNRTEWAQSALLWSFVLSQNASSVEKIRNFITKANWKSLSGDGPIAGHSSKFSTLQLGYTFDFAAQTISEPSVSFVSDGQPSSSQLAEVSSVAHVALDRMYTFALASSTLRSAAMTNYWQFVLRQDPRNFLSFVSLLISSPILLPFDAVGTAGDKPVSSLLTNSTSAPFPPPLSCYPGLTQSQLQLITNFEPPVFGLSGPAAQTDFNVSCFADRPVYGVLDVLRLRLPFQDSQTGSAKQAAILSRDAAPRVVIYSGEVLSSLPDVNANSIPMTDPRRFGTLNHINHVLLDFFEAIPDVNVATQLVEYVLSSPVTPPSNDTLLGQSLNTIPTLEAAVFGSVMPTDITGVVSSFTTPSGRLFFGTDQSLAVREWAIVATRTGVTWTESANSPKVVNDISFTDDVFNEVWNPAFTYFHSLSNAVVNVGNITAGFTSVNKFTST